MADAGSGDDAMGMSGYMDDYWDGQVALAARLCVELHDGQSDKSGLPYRHHPEAVAARVSGPLRKSAAYLHDTIEDTPATAESLFVRGVDPAVVDLVVALTHLQHEPRDDYYRRVEGAGEDAVAVKLADIEENSDPARMALLDPATRSRLEAKYDRAKVAFGMPRES